MPTSPYTNGIMPNFGVTVPPGDALNTTDAQIKGGIAPTFFADGCRFYVEASSVNGIISEILNAVNCMGLEYDPTRLDNLCLAIKAAVNADLIIDMICAASNAQKNELAACLADNIVAAICADNTARPALASCIWSEIEGTDIVAKICGQDEAADSLASCLISAQPQNQLRQGTDGRLFVPPPAEDTPLDNATVWSIRVGIGQVYLVQQSLGNVDIPPDDWDETGPVFVKLTSGDAYNADGRLIDYTESTPDSTDPTLTSTAKINVPGPLMGKTIRMLNTEQRMLRPREADGSVQNDAFQRHGHSGTAGGGNRTLIGLWGEQAGPYTFGVISNEPSAQGYQLTSMSGSGEAGAPKTLSGEQAARIADETRVKNLGVTAYMRVR